MHRRQKCIEKAVLRNALVGFGQGLIQSRLCFTLVIPYVKGLPESTKNERSF